ncbi:MAG: hypothetical protein M3065_04290 [Actinomycetota bacterium]|nr:hypothetical protein [Actinomycetota bacterium]
MSAHPFHEFDCVVVLVPLGDPDDATFPAGTRAAIVDLGPDYALVEIVEQDGTVHGPYGVGLTDLRLIEHAPAA